MSKSLPFMSIVVISHNGEKTIAASLDSLQALNYPKSHYEILVVDDASTDNTAAIVKRYSRVRYTRLAVNSGVSGARNAGLHLCRGEIYVAFDDDCLADPDWLSSLARGYATGKPAGLGATIIEPEPLKGLVTSYASSCESHLAVRQFAASTGSTTLLARLKKYVSHRMRTQRLDNQPVAVSELYGASGSFPVDLLKKVGGWRESMSGIEDRDLSRRLLQAFPNRTFYIIPTATIIHNSGQSLGQYLLRSYRRGPVNLSFYRQNHVTPPLFPFPIFYIIAVITSWWVSPLWLPLFLLLTPQLLCFWWPYQAKRRGRLIYLLFPYIQLAEESMVILGILRGYSRLARQRLADVR